MTPSLISIRTHQCKRRQTLLENIAKRYCMVATGNVFNSTGDWYKMDPAKMRSSSGCGDTSSGKKSIYLELLTEVERYSPYAVVSIVRIVPHPRTSPVQASNRMDPKGGSFVARAKFGRATLGAPARGMIADAASAVQTPFCKAQSRTPSNKRHKAQGGTGKHNTQLQWPQSEQFKSLN